MRGLSYIPAVFLSLFALGASNVLLAPHPKIHPELASRLDLVGKANIFINILGGTDSVLQNVSSTEYGSREDRLQALGAGLKDLAATTQSRIVEVLNATTGINFKSFWLSNQVYVPNAPRSLVTLLSLLPGVVGIEEEKIYQLMKPVEVNFTDFVSSRQSSGNAWGIDKIQAPTAWTTTGGNNGVGIVVANIDTGVLGSHEALVGNYRGTYGWFDPSGRTTSPNDKQGHGTHTMGTICGTKGIGVAPGAKWMACLGCQQTGCSGSDLLSCAQFMTCPTLPNGSSADCTKAPHVINNSWGGGQGQTWYNNAIAAWKTAGIIPVFSNGNAGPSCGTANSPADQDVIAVGSTDSADRISSFSSKGPSVKGVIKPELSAPGSSVRSASYSSTTGYATMSGTSMAAPHVSGVVAIMLAGKPGMTYADVRKYLQMASDKNSVVKAGTTCGGTKDSTFPNNIFGWGRVNAYWAIYYVNNA